LDAIPTDLLALVKDNIVVQWFLVVVFILIVGTNTATKLKGPIGGAARWFQAIGEKRVNREAEERRKARQVLLQRATEGNEYATQQIETLSRQLEDAIQGQEALAKLIREHMGWDFDRIQQLIHAGVSNRDIPEPPPLRVPWRGPERRSKPRDTREHQAAPSTEPIMAIE
jgi:hypothetical protein